MVEEMSDWDDILEQELDDALDVAYRKDKTQRCAALLPPDGPSLRYRRASTNRRCRRRAKVGVRGRMFCMQHTHLWETHYDILDWILAIPARD